MFYKDKSNNPNPKENFDAVYKEELELQKQLERVELSYNKVVENYKGYKECRVFADYLRMIEKVFIEAEHRNWNAEKVKEALIESRIEILASQGGVDKTVLESIYEEFRKTGVTIQKIEEAVKELLKKYEDTPDAVEFILYLQYIFVNFYESQSEELTLNELKERLVKTRMEVLSSDGKPNLVTLEKIYEEFKGLLLK